MKEILRLNSILLCFTLITALKGYGQTSFMAGNNVAVFNPDNFSSAGTLPSFAFKSNLTSTGEVPGSWVIKPVFTIENGKSVARISYNGAVDLYGTGQVSGPLRRNNTNITIWTSDSPAFAEDGGTRLYQAHPWIMGVRSDGTAFGIIADNTWKQTFNLSNPITITSDGPAFRIVVIERNNPQDLMKALGELTGTMELPALWTLGFQQCRYSYYPASQVTSIADEFRKRKLPCDVLWMDIDYMDQYKVFTFGSGFGDPTALNNYLHRKNFKSVYMIDPGVKVQPGYHVYDQGTAGNHWVQNSSGAPYVGDVWPGPCNFPDYTKPETRAWWASLYKNFMATGIDGIWNDMNEPVVFNSPGATMPETNVHGGGGGIPAGAHSRYHNVYGMLMTQASREGIVSANPDKRPFLLTRSTFLGGQRYAATWTGDNESSFRHLKLSIPMSITLGLSGQPISGPDIGGHIGNSTPDLMGHWMALGAYYPFSRNHTQKVSVQQEPWAFGPEIENVSRTALNRRYRLLPYLYTLAREASQTGMPIMRPAFFADYSDLSLRREEQAFLLGNDLLVVPRWAVNPALPKGDWDRLTLESTDDGYQAHLFIRPGSVVPLGNVVQSTADYKSDSITLLLNPLETGIASGTLYHDDGDGYAYRSNDYAIHEVLVTKLNSDSLRVVINQVEGTKNVDRKYRIGYVTETGIVYHPWSSNLVRQIPIIRDESTNPNLIDINSMYVAGDFQRELIPMKFIDKLKWKLDSLNLQSGRTYKFKFVQSNNRSTGAEWGGASGRSGNVVQNSDANATVAFTVPTAGYYSIAFDQSTLRYVIQKTPTVNSLAIVGDATVLQWWNVAGLPMQQSIEDLNVFTWIGNLYSSTNGSQGKFKFHSGPNGWCDDTWIYSAVPDQSISANGLIIEKGCPIDNKWMVQPGETGTYGITLNVATKTISIEKLVSSLSITGDATSIGWDPKGIPMQQSAARSNIFTWTGKLSASDGTTQGSFKFHSGTNGWCDDVWLYANVPDQSLSDTGLTIAEGCSVADNKWKVKEGESGIYHITVDVNARTIQIKKLNSDGSIEEPTGIGNFPSTGTSDDQFIVEVFPNPTTENFIIRASGITNTSKATLYDLTGNKMIEINAKNSMGFKEVKFPVTHLIPGTYILKIETERGVSIKKIIKW